MPPSYSYTSTPTSSCNPQSYHPALHYRTSIPPGYLPNDEYRYLVKQQDHSRLKAHFAQPSLPSSSHKYPRPKTAYQEQGNLSRERRTKISKTAFATRAALGPSFDFTDKGFESVQRDSSRGTRDEEEGMHADYVPSRYIAELSEKYWDEDKKYREEQYRKNGYLSSTQRRANSGRYADAVPLPLPPREFMPPRRERCDSGTGDEIVYGPTPQLGSMFSDSSTEDEAPKRGLWERARRSKEKAG